MYIREVCLKRIKRINELQLQFEEGQEAGWHVLLGDNGAGKTSVIRAIALGLIGPNDYKALRLNLREWISSGQNKSEIGLCLTRDYLYDQAVGSGKGAQKKPFWAILEIMATDGAGTIDRDGFILKQRKDSNADAFVWGDAGGWFSAGFGPFRRFYGGDPEVVRIYLSVPSAAAHVSMFGENVAFFEALTWLKDLHNAKQDGKELQGKLLALFIKFINNSNLLPHATSIKEINNDGVFFEDGNHVEVHISKLSDGFRSMLSLMFELLRQLLRVYQMDAVFVNADQPVFSIDLPGVVLIDEVDAHLHPTWQTRIGSWFTTYFPNMQFIVTTHSPLICRGASKGTIWKLPNPGTDDFAFEIKGTEKDKLVYGTVLDAYETDEFGAGVTRGEEGKEWKKRFYDLAMKRRFDVPMTDQEQKEFVRLQQIFQVNVED